MLIGVAVAVALGAVGCGGAADEGDAGPGNGAADRAPAAGEDVDEADAALEAERAVHALSGRFQQLMEQEQRLDPVIGDAEELVQRYPDHWPARMLAGKIMLADERHAAAYAHFTRALELEPEDAELRVLAGTVALELAEPDEALEHYRHAVSLEPREPRYRLHLAHIHTERDRYDEARHQLLVALRHDASNHKAYAAMADLYGKQNEIGPALEAIRRALELLPADGRLNEDERRQKLTYVRRRAMLLRRDLKPADALSVLRDLPERQQFDRGVMEDLASCWAMLDEPESAAAHYAQAVRRDPNDAEAAAEAAHWYLRAEQPAEARDMIERLQRINPRHTRLAELREQVSGHE